ATTCRARRGTCFLGKPLQYRGFSARMFTTGDYCLTQTLFLLSFRPSRPSRGVVARRREGGAGCGTRERGEREPRPRAALGKPPRGTKTAGPVRLAVNAKAVMPRGASRGRGRTRHVRQGPGVPGPPVKNGPVWRNPDHAPSRRATPLMGRKKRDGQPPSPAEAGGDEARLFDKLNRMHECHCVVPLCSWARPLSVRPHESGDPVFAPARLAPGSLLARDERRMILFEASPNDDCGDLL